MHSKIFAVLGEVLEGLEVSLSPAGHHNQEPRRGSDVVNGFVPKKVKKGTIFYNFISFGQWVSKVHQTLKTRLYLSLSKTVARLLFAVKVRKCCHIVYKMLFFQLIYWE